MKFLLTHNKAKNVKKKNLISSISLLKENYELDLIFFLQKNFKKLFYSIFLLGAYYYFLMFKKTQIHNLNLYFFEFIEDKIFA